MGGNGDLPSIVIYVSRLEMQDDKTATCISSWRYPKSGSGTQLDLKVDQCISQPRPSVCMKLPWIKTATRYHGPLWKLLQEMRKRFKYIAYSICDQTCFLTVKRKMTWSLLTQAQRSPCLSVCKPWSSVLSWSLHSLQSHRNTEARQPD